MAALFQNLDAVLAEKRVEELLAFGVIHGRQMERELENLSQVSPPKGTVQRLSVALIVRRDRAVDHPRVDSQEHKELRRREDQNDCLKDLHDAIF